MRSIFLTAIVASLLLSCAEGGEGAPGGGGLPEGSSVTCGDFEVDLSQSGESEAPEDEDAGEDVVEDGPTIGIGNPAVSRAVNERIDELHMAGMDVVEVRYSKESVVVVGCGGTVINNTTTVSNELSGSGTED